MPVIQVRNLTRKFKVWKRSEKFVDVIKSLFKREYEEKVAVDHVSFKVRRKERVAIIGPNGAGKSTLIKMLTGILWPTSGTAKVLGYIPWKQREEYCRHIGVLFGQKSQLWWVLPALDGYQYLAAIYNVSDWKERIQDYIKLLEIEEIVKKPLRNLSLGERMRCELIAALIHNPEILFLDEPTIGIDVEAKEKIREFLKGLGKTIIFTTHDMNDVEDVCERVIILDKGRKIFDGKLKTLVKRYVKTRVIEAELKVKPRIKPQRKIGNTYYYEVPREETMRVVRQLMRCKPIDLVVKEPPIEKIIAAIYRRGKCS